MNEAVRRVGFAGLGTMGAAMAANLVRGGFEVAVWNRSPGRAAEVVALGASQAASPADLATGRDAVVLCVRDTPDVEAVLFGSAGIVDGSAPGLLVIDCSTIDPDATRRFGERLAERGVALVDAPVSGGSEGARQGTLSIMVGGADADVSRARPVLEAMGRTITHVGPLGAGQATKAVNQVILAGTYLAVAEGIVLAMKSGLDPQVVIQALGAGAAASWVLANRSERMIRNEYPIGFKLALHRKDLGIALGMAQAVGAALPVAGLAAEIENGLIAQGHGEDDNSALARAIRAWSGLEG
jgi:3-hydroxyisobutyrate dehydrogenase